MQQTLPPPEQLSPQQNGCCSHCGLAMNTPVDLTDNEPVFCCNGCRGAYELIHGWGLSDFYALRDQLQNDGITRVADASHSYEEFDNPEFLGDAQPQEIEGGMLATRLAVHGLHCGACAWLIENVAARTPGLIEARVRFSDHSVGLLYDPNQLSLSEIARVLDRLGYELAPPAKLPEEPFRLENRRLLTQIAIAGFCAANAMWIAIALYAGEATGLAAQHEQFLRVIGSSLGIGAVVLPGRTFLRGALAAIRTCTPHMDLPVALGLLVGSAVGMLNAVLGGGAVYFDSLAVLVFLLLIGRWIQFRQQHRSAHAVELLLRITPRHASRVTPDGIEKVLVDNLQVGDRVRISPGDGVPADGVIHVGQSTVDQSLLTGESVPVAVKVGDQVLAGTVNRSKPIDVEVQAVGAQSRAGRIAEAVEDALSSKPPVVQLADRIGGVFVVVVTLLASATFLWWYIVDWRLAAANATSLLIVACPCALALATPLAIAVSIGQAARQRMFVRDGNTFQLLAQKGTIWFDKTGTLTHGKPRVESVFGDSHAIELAACLERDCCHPLADAIISVARDRGLSLDHPVNGCEVHVGGITGIVEGHQIAVGNPTFHRSHEFTIRRALQQGMIDIENSGASPILISVDGQVVAVLGIADSVKPEASKTIKHLQSRGWRVGILSGDSSDVVRKVAGVLGIQTDLALGELSPEQKLAIVKGESSSVPHPGHSVTVMVGDGANDAAALAAADVGIAVRGGAEVCLQAAPAYVSTGNLSSITSLVQAGKSASRLIQTTFGVSIAYNVLAVSLAIMGLISPLIAAVLMPISSVTVLSVTLAWPVFKENVT